jgi:hypothetical protein
MQDKLHAGQYPFPYFAHCNVKNFCRNFCNFAASLGLETEYSSAKQRKAGKLHVFYFILMSRLSPPCCSEYSEEGTTHVDNNDAYKDNNDEDKVRDDDEDAKPPKEVRSAATTKKPAAATPMTLPAPRPMSNFSVNTTNKFSIAYYCKGTQDYADVVIHVNGVIQEGKFLVSISQYGRSVLWQRSMKSV